MALYLARAGPVPAPELFRLEELEQVAYGMKRGKSAGPDRVVYEHVHILLASELKVHVLDFLNRILVGVVDFPAEWFESQVAFLAKTAQPSVPKDLRPILLSPVSCKIFPSCCLCA